MLATRNLARVRKFTNVTRKPVSSSRSSNPLCKVLHQHPQQNSRDDLLRTSWYPSDKCNSIYNPNNLRGYIVLTKFINYYSLAF